MLKVIAEVSAAEEKRLPRSDDVNTMMAWREEGEEGGGGCPVSVHHPGVTGPSVMVSGTAASRTT